MNSNGPSGINNNNGELNSHVKNSSSVATLDRHRLQELVQQVDPNEHLEEEVEDVLLSLADDFIENVVSKACMFAKHRKSSHLDVSDVQLSLDINWNMWIPGFGVDGVVGVFNGTNTSQVGQQSSTSSASSMVNRAPKKCLSTEAHKQRLALIKKNMKKL